MVIALQAGIVLLAIFMLVALIFGLKSWKFFHVFAVFLIFSATLPFLVYTSFVLKTRLAWMSWHSFYEREVSAREAEAVKLHLGDLDAVKQELDNVTEAHIRHNALLYGRGRVWRNVKPNAMNAAGDQMTINVPVPRPAPPADPGLAVDPAAADGGETPPPAPVPPPVIPPNTTLFAFKDIRNADGISVPDQYVGAFQVTASAPGSATLTPSRPLDPVQKRIAQTADPRFTWSFYEKMPTDRHDVFTDDTFTDEERRKFIPTIAKLQSMLPKLAYYPNATAEEYDKKIAAIRRQFEIDILHDGKPISELEAAYPGVFVERADEVVAEVEFTQDYKIEVDADSPGQDSPSETAYDSQGRAQISSLMQSHDPVSAGSASEYSSKDGKATTYTQFRDKQRAEFDLETAEQLQRDGVLKIVTKKYRRKLHDFEQEFRDHYLKQVQMRRQLGVLRNENLALTTKVTQMSGPDPDVIGGLQKEREVEVETLRADLKGYQNEHKELAQAIATMKQEKAAFYQKLGALYTRNLALADELARIQQEILREAEKRAQEAVEKARSET